MRSALTAVAPASGRAASAWRTVAQAARPRAWFHFLLLPLAGASDDRLSLRLGAQMGGAMVAAALLWAGIYLINSHSDVEIDGRAKNALVRAGASTMHLAGAVSLALLAGACAVAWSVGPTPALAALASAMAGIAYSAGPRLKRLPLIGTVSNVAIFAPGLFLGVIAEAGMAQARWLAIPFSVLLIQNQLVHEIADADDDASGAVLTTFRWCGSSGVAAILLLSGLSGAAAVFARASGPLAAALALALLLPAPALMIAAGGGSRSVAARLRALHRRYALLVGAAFWLVGRAPT